MVSSLVLLAMSNLFIPTVEGEGSEIDWGELYEGDCMELNTGEGWWSG